MDLLAGQECLDHPVFLVLKGRVDLVETLEHQVFKDLQDQKEDEARPVQLDFVVTKEQVVNEEIEEKKVTKDFLVLLDYLDLQVNKEIAVFQDNLDLKVFGEKLDLVVFLVQMVLKDQWDLLGLLDHVDLLVSMVLKDPKVLLDHLDLRDHLDKDLIIQCLLLLATKDLVLRVIKA